MNDLSLEFTNNCDYIIISQELDENNYLDKFNENEGLIIKVWNNKMNKYNIYKILNDNYKYKLFLDNNDNLYKQILYKFVNNKLSKDIKINNYNAIGVITLTLKLYAEELYNLFNFTFNTISEVKQNEHFYLSLDLLYKEFLYNIRSVYYKNKNELKKIDVYYYLKNLDVNKLLNLILLRKNSKLFENNNKIYNMYLQNI